MTATTVAAESKGPSLATIVGASALGATFEWYDFFVFGALTPVIAKNFFAGLDPTSGLVAALGLFGAGFFFRPIGALIFGRVGDVVGRKGTFLATVILMGGSTFAIGLLPTWKQAGIVAPILLILLRIFQGTALGGEYGGAATFVAEHAPSNRRGFATSWVQASAAFGLVGALLVIYFARQWHGEAAFEAADWTGLWRVPFLVSAALLAVSVWMRLRLTESPAFLEVKAAGAQSSNPYAEAFARWDNLKIVLSVLVGIMSAQGAAWYTLFFYAEQVFLERFMKIDPSTGTGLLLAISAASAPLYIFFAWLSDKVGRKWVMWGGMTLALVAFFPGFRALAHYSNPALAAAQARTPVVVYADPSNCSLQFDLTGKARFDTACDIAKSTLSNAGVSYRNHGAPVGTPAEIRIGALTVVSRDAKSLPEPQRKAVVADVKSRIQAALKTAGYPTKADPARMNVAGIFGVLMVFVVACTALFGPIAATLVELFPTRIRYTAMSLPYHIGTGWIGGFMPVTAFLIVTVTGDIYAGLWYPVIFTGLSVLTLPLLLRETRGRPLNP